jgi:hypothetical protein
MSNSSRLARAALALVTIATLLFLPTAQAHRGVRQLPPRGHTVGAPVASPLVLQWYDLTGQAVTAAALPEQVTQDRVWAVSWLAAARAAGHHPRRRRPFSEPAAFATALHDTLVALVPGQATQLDAALATTLASVPDGRGRERGIATGRQEAARALAERAGDGLDTASVDIAWTPPPAAPGVYQPTPPTFGPVIRAGLPHARGFLLERNDAFRPGPPPALGSKRYLDALAEVHAVGRDTSAVRTAAQTDVARFWAQNSIDAYVQVLRAALAASPASLARQARLVAAFHAVEIDTQIAIYDAKYTYVFWRPVTAIRTGAVDPDPSWTPLLATPRHPEYPSGHTGYAGAAQAVLERLVGRRPSTPIGVTSSTDPGVTHVFDAWPAITQENVDGRVWEGVHFRFSDEASVGLGRRVAEHDLARLHRIGL